MSNDNNDLTRRNFNAMALAAGAAASTGGIAQAAGLPLTETDVTIKTADGTCDAAFIHPTEGTHPAVIIWPDAFGLRPAFRDMAKRLAAHGYSVLVPNPYYRTTKAPGITTNIDFNNADDRKKLGALMGPVTTPGASERDTVSFITFLDTQDAVNKKAKIGTQGYCMGGPLTMRTASAAPDRVGAAISCHGGGLVTDGPDSPHLLASKIKAQYYFAIAESDDMKQPDAKVKLKAAFDAAKGHAKIEVYPGSVHGWCVPDMPAPANAPIYNKPLAERAWSHVIALYKTNLV